MAEPPEPMDPYEALRIIEVFVSVAEETDNPDAIRLILREVRDALHQALPKKARRGQQPKA